MDRNSDSQEQMPIRLDRLRLASLVVLFSRGGIGPARESGWTSELVYIVLSLFSDGPFGWRSLKDDARLMAIRGDRHIEGALVPERQLSHSLVAALPEVVKAVLYRMSLGSSPPFKEMGKDNKTIII
jgi:hypothetical protein